MISTTTLHYDGIQPVRNDCKLAVLEDYNVSKLVYSDWDSTWTIRRYTRPDLKSLTDRCLAQTPNYHSISHDFKQQEVGNSAPLIVLLWFYIIFLLLTRLVWIVSFPSYCLTLRRNRPWTGSLSILLVIIQNYLCEPAKILWWEENPHICAGILISVSFLVCMFCVRAFHVLG